MERCIADANPTGIDPARDVIATALEHLLIAEIRMMQTHELEHLPRTVRVSGEIAEEVGFARVEWSHHLTRHKISCREPSVHATQDTLATADTGSVIGKLARGQLHRLVRPLASPRVHR